MSYNGWSNRETWLVGLWFNIETPEDIDFAKESLEYEYENLSDVMRDFVSLDAIDWDEISDHLDADEAENE